MDSRRDRSEAAPAPAAVLDDVHLVVTGRGPHPVVLLHGFSDNLLTWRRVVPALAVEHRVVSIDLPGHGASARGWTRPLLDGYAALVGEVLDALELPGPVSLVGNSMGAAVAGVLAARQPHRVDAAVLIGMPGLSRLPAIWRAAASRPVALALRAALRPVPVAQLQRGAAWVYAHAASPRVGTLDPATLSGYGACYADRQRLFGLSELARAMLAELREVRLEQLLAEVDVPVLRVWGRHDRVVPPRGIAPDERTVLLPGCGHCPQLDAPDRLLDVLLPFLAEHAVDEPVPAAVGS